MAYTQVVKVVNGTVSREVANSLSEYLLNNSNGASMGVQNLHWGAHSITIEDNLAMIVFSPKASGVVEIQTYVDNDRISYGMQRLMAFTMTHLKDLYVSVYQCLSLGNESYFRAYSVTDYWMIVYLTNYAGWHPQIAYPAIISRESLINGAIRWIEQERLVDFLQLRTL